MSTIPAESSATGAVRGRGAGRERRGRGLILAAGWALGTVALFAVYLRLARTRAVNSDGASQALQAWNILHGNLLMHGWVLTDVSFYTTEIPEYMLVELVRGLGQDVVHVAAAVTYTLAVLFAALLAKGTARGREAVIRVLLAAGIMLAPQLNAGTNVLLSSPDHVGTSVPVMLAFLVLDRCVVTGRGRRGDWWVPGVTFVLLAWSMIADELVLVIGIVPLIAVCAVRAGHAALAARRAAAPIWPALRYEAALAVAAAAAAVVATGALRLIGSAGGFASPPAGSQLAPLPLIAGHNLPLTGNGLLLLGGAYLPGLPAGAGTWLGALHIAGIALAAVAAGVTAWRFFRRDADRVSQLLLAGIVIDVVAYAAGTHATNLASTREIAPVLPFAAILAGRQLGPRLLARKMITLPVLALVLAGYVAGLGLELTAPAAPPQNARLAAWLSAHPMGTGLSGYWESNVVTLTSGGRRVLRPVGFAGGRFVPVLHNSAAPWFDPATSRADFVVFGPASPGHPGDPADPGFGGREEAVAAFGKPWRVYRVGRYTILRWRRNLLADLGPASLPDRDVEEVKARAGTG